MRNLRISQKLAVICVLFGVSIIVLLYLLVSEKNIAIDFAQKEVYGDAYLRPLKKVIQNVAIHENQWHLFKHAGAEEYKSKTATSVAGADSALNELDAKEAELGALLNTKEKLDTVKAKWKAFKSGIEAADEATADKLHEDVLGAAHALLLHVGDTSNLILDPDLDSYYVMDATLLKLLDMAEQTMVLASYASDVVRTKVRTPDDKTRLLIVTTKLKDNLDGLARDIQIAIRENGAENLKPALEKMHSDMQGNLKSLVEKVEKHLIEPGTAELASHIGEVNEKIVVEEGIKNAESVYAFWDKAVDELDVLLINRIKGFQYKKYTALLFVAIMISVNLVVIYFMIKSITEPIASGVAFADRIAGGDLAHHDIVAYGKDEIASLTMSLNKMKGSLGSVVVKIGDAASHVKSSSQDLAVIAHQVNQSVNAQTNRTNQVAASITQMSQTVYDIAKNASAIAISATQTSGVAKSGEGIVEKSVEEVKSIAHSVAESANTMKFLAERSKQIGEIVDVINDIADQTNLLALNAAIEAASAGEHGRGFAVVADEVRQLAKRTATATSEISKMIKDVQEDVRKAVSSMDMATKNVDSGVNFSMQAGQALRNIVDSVDQLQMQINQIATATEEMSSTSEQISGDVSAIASASKEVASGYEQISKSSGGLSGLASKLQDIVGQFRV